MNEKFSAKLIWNKKTEKYQIILNDKLIVAKTAKKEDIKSILSYKLKKYKLSHIIDTTDNNKLIKAFTKYENLNEEERAKFETFKQECTACRTYINDDLHPHMSKIAALAFFLCDSNEFKLIKDMLYYKGGYPNANSPPKLDEICRKIGIIAQIYKYIGKADEMNSILANFGVKIEFSNETYFNFPNTFDKIRKEQNTADLKRIDKHIKCVFKPEEVPINSEDFIKALFDKALSLQAEICQLADLIKIDAAKKVEEELNIPKQTFVSIVEKQYLKNKREKQKLNLEDKDFINEYRNLKNSTDVLSIFNMISDI